MKRSGGCSSNTTTIVSTTQWSNLFVLILVTCLHYGQAAMTDPATGIAFAPRLQEEKEIVGVGVRKKGPIKIYSVGMYVHDDILKESLLESSVSSDKSPLDILRERATASASTFPSDSTTSTEDEGTTPPKAANVGTSFVLKMNFKVGADKMASAIAESVIPRYSQEHGADSSTSSATTTTAVVSDVETLKDLIAKGIDGVATKGTILQFDCTSEGLGVCVNGKEQGVVPSRELAKAFCDIYLDEKSVSPTLRASCLETLSSIPPTVVTKQGDNES